MASINASTAGVGGVITTADNTGILNIQTAGTTAVTVTASQNVGIGTASPATKLNLGGSSDQSFQINGSGTAAFVGTSVAIAQISSNRNPTTGAIYDPARAVSYINLEASSGNGNIQFFTTATNNINATERMRIDASGNVLVGTTSSVDNVGNGLKVLPASGNTAITCTGAASSGANSYHLYSTGASAYRFYVSYSGQIFATSTSISAISDETLKENIKDLETGLSEVMALRPRRFDWKNGDAQNVAGFVAQEVEQVLPELVADYVYNKDENGNDTFKKSLKMGDILPTLVNAIQEQQAMIQELKAEIDLLKGAK